MNQARQQSDSAQPTIDIRWPRIGVAHIILGGEHDLSSANRLDRTLTETLGWCSRMIADLREARFIDSSTIHALVATAERARASNRVFKVVLAPTSIVERTLGTAEVTLPWVHTLEEALPAAGDLRATMPPRLGPLR